MGKLYNSGSPISKVYNVSLNAPFDTRLTVQNVADLTDGENGGIASLVYRGMVVYVHQDKLLMVPGRTRTMVNSLMVEISITGKN